MPALVQGVIVCAPEGGDPLRPVGGLSLLERLLRQFSEIERIESILVIKPRELSLPPPSERVRKPVSFLDAAGSDAWGMLRESQSNLSPRFVTVSADLLIDQRLLEWLAGQDRDVLLSWNASLPAEAAGNLHPEALEAAALPRLDVVEISSIPTYWESMHGDVPMHVLRVRGGSDPEKGWAILLDHIQRRTLDLPARYFDPRFENLLVRALAPTKITANQVTLATTLLGFGVAALYFEGWLRIGVLLAIFVEVLDGVDGKLARITWTTSRIGEYEHILDFFYENSWYLALGGFLSRSGHHSAWSVALLMVVFDLTDNVAYALLDVGWGRSLDNVSAFLQRFRLIAGRRNIYSWMFLPGFLLGAPAISFYTATTWAGVTAAIHAAVCLGEARRLMRAPYAQSASPR